MGGKVRTLAGMPCFRGWGSRGEGRRKTFDGCLFYSFLTFRCSPSQALHGKNRTPAPSWWNALERAKWDAWASLDQMSQLEAMVFYVQLVEKVCCRAVAQ